MGATKEARIDEQWYAVMPVGRRPSHGDRHHARLHPEHARVFRLSITTPNFQNRTLFHADNYLTEVREPNIKRGRAPRRGRT